VFIRGLSFSVLSAFGFQPSALGRARHSAARRRCESFCVHLRWFAVSAVLRASAPLLFKSVFICVYPWSKLPSSLCLLLFKMDFGVRVFVVQNDAAFGSLPPSRLTLSDLRQSASSADGF